MHSNRREYCAFSDDQQIAHGELLGVALAARDASAGAAVLVFDLQDGRQVDVLHQGDDDAVESWVREHLGADADGAKARGRGRPKLGVVGREVTLLPRQWDWLAAQPGGASVTLRKLVDEAAKRPQARRDAAREATYRFLNAVAGNYPAYEDALRALYAGDRQAFDGAVNAWPPDVVRRAQAFAEAAW